MKHFLTLSDEDGRVLERWCIEEEIGDLNRRAARVELAETIVDALRADSRRKEGK